MPNWLSSDSGSLWKSGRPLYAEGQWATTRPTALKAGDVVQLSVLANGTLQIHCNGTLQASWASAEVPTDRPLYAIAGMRAPLKAVLLRQKARRLHHDVLPPPSLRPRPPPSLHAGPHPLPCGPHAG